MEELIRYVDLIAEQVVYFSEYDESAFFEWIKKIPCIVGVFGIGTKLHLKIRIDNLDKHDLREIIAVYERYHIDKRPIAALDRGIFRDWLHDKTAYWYRDIFD